MSVHAQLCDCAECKRLDEEDRRRTKNKLPKLDRQLRLPLEGRRSV